MRIAGLASGMDIESMVKDLMRAERMPLDKLKQKKQILEWQRDDYRALNTKMLTFRDKLSALKLTSNYRARNVTASNDAYVSATATSGASQASYSISKVTQLASAATRKNAGGISKDGNKIDPTKTLASQKDALGTGVTWDDGVVESKTINVTSDKEPVTLDLYNGSIKYDSSEIDSPLVSIKVNGKTYEVIKKIEGQTLEAGQVSVDSEGNLTFGTELKKDDVVKIDYVLDSKTQTITTDDVPLSGWNLGKSSITSLKMTFTGDFSGTYKLGEVKDGFAEIVREDGGEPQSIGKINMSTGSVSFAGFGDDGKDGIPPNTEISVTYTQDYASFGINTHTSKGEMNEKFFITGNDTLNSVIRKVNESDAGVTMFYDSFSDQMTLTRKETGDFNKDLDKNNGAEIQVSGAFIESVLKFAGGTETGGQNAKFTINGLETERNSNTFEMSGVTFTLKQKFDAEAENSNIQPASITVGNDTNQVFENIKAFVEQYNELIAEIGGKLNEEKYRSYQPLTDDEREALSEKQQEKWEEMARSGLLKGDSALSSVLSSMRLDMSSSVETNGMFRQLASIGIKTTANYMEGGKLEIDEAKLKEALEKDPESVENLFRGTGSDANEGIVHKLYNTVDASIEKLREKAGRATSTNQQFTIGRQLVNVDKSIDRFEDKLKLTEERYWRQFTAMEKAIQRANEQSSFLMNQFGGGM